MGNKLIRNTDVLGGSKGQFCKAFKGLEFIIKASPVAQGMFVLCCVLAGMEALRNS